jgi:hypothetical protein
MSDHESWPWCGAMESYLKPIRTASKAAWSTDHQDEVDGKYDTRHDALRGDCREASASGMKLGVSGLKSPKASVAG